MKHYDHLETRAGNYSHNGFHPRYEKRARSGFFIDPSFLIFLAICVVIALVEFGIIP